MRAVLDDVRALTSASDGAERAAAACDRARLEQQHSAPLRKARAARAAACDKLAQTVKAGDLPRLSAECMRAEQELRRVEAAAAEVEAAARAAEAAAQAVGREALAAAESAARDERRRLEKEAEDAPDAVFRHERRRGAAAARLHALAREREALRQQLQQVERAAEAAAAALRAAAGDALSD
jgi:hypothetical protein